MICAPRNSKEHTLKRLNQARYVHTSILQTYGGVLKST